VFGEISFLNGNDFSATIATLTECEITWLSRANFDRLEKENIHIAYKIIVSLAKALSDKLLTMNQLL